MFVPLVMAIVLFSGDGIRKFTNEEMFIVCLFAQSPNACCSSARTDPSVSNLYCNSFYVYFQRPFQSGALMTMQ